MRGPFDQVAGIGEPAAGGAEVVGIDSHVCKNRAGYAGFLARRGAPRLARASPLNAIDGGHYVMETLQQRQG